MLPKKQKKNKQKLIREEIIELMSALRRLKNQKADAFKTVSNKI